MEIGNSRRVKAQHEYHAASVVASSLKAQSAIHPVAPFEGLRPAPSSLFEKHRGTSDSVADMPNAQTWVGDTQDQKGNTFQLSGRSAVKRASTNLLERRDSKMTSGRSPVVASYHIVADRPTSDRPPTLRRFTFDLISDRPLLDLAEMEARIGCLSESRSELGRVSYRAVPKARDTASPSLISRDAGRKLTDVPQIFSSNNDRRLDEAREERGLEKTGTEKVRTERRHIPTTFDEILDRRRTPTALS